MTFGLDGVRAVGGNCPFFFAETAAERFPIIIRRRAREMDAR